MLTKIIQFLQSICLVASYEPCDPGFVALSVSATLSYVELLRSGGFWASKLFLLIGAEKE